MPAAEAEQRRSRLLGSQDHRKLLWPPCYNPSVLNLKFVTKLALRRDLPRRRSTS